MDISIVAALIGVGGSVVGAVLGSWFSYRLTKPRLARAELRVIESQDALVKAEGAALDAGHSPEYQLLAALKVDAHEVEWSFDDAGRGLKILKFLGVRPLQVVQDLRIPFYDDVSREGRGHRYPEVAALGGTSRLISLDEAHLGFSDHTVHGHVVIHGLLTPESKAESFLVRIPFDGIFFLTLPEAEAAFVNDAWQEDYGRIAVHCPLGRLRLTVTFPPSFAAMTSKPKPVVFYAHTETVHEIATRRLDADSSCFTYRDLTAQLDVVAPAIGLSYGISWLPPVV